MDEQPSRSVAAALARAAADADAPSIAPPDGRPRQRRYAIGDLQAPPRTLFSILDGLGLLGEDGRLAPDVFLVSIGDHFDYGPPDRRAEATRGGLETLAWLAAHPADQVAIVLGNHDLSRVAELWAFDDDAYARARADAERAYRRGAPDPRLQVEFLRAHPGLASAEMLARDLSGFSTAQRSLVEALLRSGRAELAHAAGRDLLLAHAGVTADDLRAVGLSEPEQRDAVAIADRLRAHLAAAVGRWREGPIDLSPLHTLPSAGGESRGMFAHRPSDPEREAPSLFAGPPRRRYDPRTLPLGLTQAIGHIRDGKARRLLARWASPEPALDGPLRYLVTDGAEVRYARGVGEASPDRARMIFLDGGMLHAEPERYQLLDLVTKQPL